MTRKLMILAVTLTAAMSLMGDGSNTAYVNGTWWKYYVRDDGTAEVFSCSINATGCLNIPYAFDGYPVSRLSGSGGLKNLQEITSVSIPSSVTFIGEGVFSGCNSLTNINIPEGVTSIGDSAFRNCTSLTSIEIPEGVTSIEKDAFAYCRIV